jgi:hypothetical protein
MKHIKKFNEELSPRVYSSAAVKLKKMGHERRSKELEEHAETAAKREEIIRWKKNIDEYSKYGKIKLRFKANKYNKKEYEGDFYFQLVFNDDIASESIGGTMQNSKGYFDFSIPFFVGIIPVDEETKQLCDHNMTDSDFSNGFYWGLWVSIRYKVEDEKIKFNDISYNTYDESLTGSIEFADRKSAVVFKKTLKYCFEELSDYPSDSTKTPDIYDLLYRTLCQELELLPDYNLSMEKILSDINSFSINKLYKE